MRQFLYQVSNEIEWWIDFCRIDRVPENMDDIIDNPVNDSRYNFFTLPRTEKENQKIVLNILCFLIFLIFILLMILAYVQTM